MHTQLCVVSALKMPVVAECFSFELRNDKTVSIAGPLHWLVDLQVPSTRQNLKEKRKSNKLEDKANSMKPERL